MKNPSHEVIVNILKAFREMVIADGNRVAIRRFNKLHRNGNVHFSVGRAIAEDGSSLFMAGYNFGTINSDSRGFFVTGRGVNVRQVDGLNHLEDMFEEWEVYSCKLTEVPVIDIKYPTWVDVLERPIIGELGVSTLKNTFIRYFGLDDEYACTEAYQFYSRFFDEEQKVPRLKINIIAIDKSGAARDCLIQYGEDVIGLAAYCNTSSCSVYALSNDDMAYLMQHIKETIHALYGSELQYANNDAWNIVNSETEIEDLFPDVCILK